MTQPVIDLSNYKDRSGGRVEEGTYKAVVEDVEYGKSKSDKPMFTIWFRIIEGPFKDVELIDRLTQTENAMFRTVSFLQAIGQYPGKKKFQVNMRAWIGRRIDLEVRDGEPYNGRVKSEVAGHIRPSDQSGAESSATSDAVGDLDDVQAPEPTPEPQVAQESVPVTKNRTGQQAAPEPEQQVIDHENGVTDAEANEPVDIASLGL